MRAELKRFEDWWRQQHQENPAHFPMAMAENNAGAWGEMLEAYSSSIDREALAPEPKAGQARPRVLTGQAAINYAEARGKRLNKYADPLEGAREEILLEEAIALAEEDPGLVWVEASR